MRGELRRGVGRALLRASAEAMALLFVALLLGAGAFWLTARNSRVSPPARGAAADFATAVDAPRTLLAPRPAPPRARPAAEPEALTRIVPPAAPVTPVQAQARTLSVEDTPPPALGAGDRLVASLSFYYCEYSAGTAAGDGGGFCGVMRDGSTVYPGAAACDFQYLGQLFRIQGDPAGRIYRCADTGSAIHNERRDIWFHSSAEGWQWQLQVGRTAEIEILP